jgi:hypothetical protein
LQPSRPPANGPYVLAISEHELLEKKVVGGVDVKPTPAITDVDTATQILGVLQGVRGMNKTVSAVAEEVSTEVAVDLRFWPQTLASSYQA